MSTSGNKVTSCSTLSLLTLSKDSFTIEVLTAHRNCDMMELLRKSSETVESNIVSKEGEHELLRSSKVDSRSPSLGFNSNDPILSDELLIDYLASILVEAFLEQEMYGDRKQKSGDLLPSVNQRAS